MSGLKLFSIGEQGVAEIAAHSVVRERHLQELVEANMEAFLGGALPGERLQHRRPASRADRLPRPR
ncbi:hypothetical protein GCM10020000_03920 [Streptomyces olivoverticillatus]